MDSRHEPELSSEDRILTASEVARVFRVDAKTVTRWANQGRIPCFRTLGGHRRFVEADILAARTAALAGPAAEPEAVAL